MAVDKWILSLKLYMSLVTLCVTVLRHAWRSIFSAWMATFSVSSRHSRTPGTNEASEQFICLFHYFNQQSLVNLRTAESTKSRESWRGLYVLPCYELQATSVFHFWLTKNCEGTYSYYARSMLHWIEKLCQLTLPHSLCLWLTID